MTKIEFGTIIIDKLHQFFGKRDPRACIVVSAWSDEDDDDEDTEVWLEHYRGHFRKSYADLHDETKWEILDMKIDTARNVLAQLELAEERFVKNNPVEDLK